MFLSNTKKEIFFPVVCKILSILFLCLSRLLQNFATLFASIYSIREKCSPQLVTIEEVLKFLAWFEFSLF